MKIHIETMGCAKNSVDSEKLMGLLRAAGHSAAPDARDADAVIINTCGFIQDAVKENIDVILGYEDMRRDGDIDALLVVGCLVNRYGDDLKNEIPLVDFWARAEDWLPLLRFLNGGSDANTPLDVTARANLSDVAASRYLKIGEGCDSFCAYCTIPRIRGRARSVPIERLVAEAERLCAEGARELCLVGQDLTLYGRDLYGEPALEKLLSELERATPDGTWLRLLYLHPNRVTHALLDKVASSDKIVHYLDIPIQHIDEGILRAMNRAGDAKQITEVFRYARECDKLFALRTTLMVGFPGETNVSFQKLLDFVEEAEIDRLGAFMFSAEDGTPAAALPNQVEKNVKSKRYARLMKAQAAVSARRQSVFNGKQMKVLVESVDNEDKIAWGRTYRDAPEVDGQVGVSFAGKSAKKRQRAGEFITARIDDALEYDMFGEWMP